MVAPALENHPSTLLVRGISRTLILETHRRFHVPVLVSQAATPHAEERPVLSGCKRGTIQSSEPRCDSGKSCLPRRVSSLHPQDEESGGGDSSRRRSDKCASLTLTLSSCNTCVQPPSVSASTSIVGGELFGGGVTAFPVPSLGSWTKSRPLLERVGSPEVVP